MHDGNHGQYFWLETKALRLVELLKSYSAILQDKYVVVTAYDSGPLHISTTELALGWIQQDQLAYSPKVKSVNDIPRGKYDEWYIFRDATHISIHEIFVNDSGFTLRDSAYLLQKLEPTWDKGMRLEFAEMISQKQSNFWHQLEKAQPESYLSEGDKLIFVTKNAEIHKTLLLALSNRT